MLIIDAVLNVIRIVARKLITVTIRFVEARLHDASDVAAVAVFIAEEKVVAVDGRFMVATNWRCRCGRGAGCFSKVQVIGRWCITIVRRLSHQTVIVMGATAVHFVLHLREADGDRVA